MTRQIVRIAAFCAAALFGTLVAQAIWTALLSANLTLSPALPWSVLVMAVLLWASWRYFGGAWRPASTQEARRRYRRSNPVPGRVFGLSLVAGMLGLAGLVALWLVVTQLVKVPGNPASNFAKYPPLTVVAVVVMASLVGAITEEVGLRGYMLTRLQASVGGWLAVPIVALVISPGHGATQGFVAPTLLWYFIADLMFGALAVLTGSIRPAIVVHAIGLLTFFAVVWPTDRFRHAGSLGQQPVAFWVELTLCLVLLASSLVVFRRLAAIGSASVQGPRMSAPPQRA